MNWYLQPLKKYAVFSGRSQRTEYWLFALFNWIAGFILGLADGLLGLHSDVGLGLLGGLYTLALLIPGLAVSVRRLHDTGRSGWWLLIALVPIIGAIVLIVFMATDSSPGENKYGPNPKEGAA